MAFVFVAVVFGALGEFPVPYDLGALIEGWLLYCLFTFCLCLVLAPLSELSDVLEKLVPVTTYIVIPFSGTFNMTAWLTPPMQKMMYWSPFVQAMELVRHGIFGPPACLMPSGMPQCRYSDLWSCCFAGLAISKRVRRTMVVE